MYLSKEEQETIIIFNEAESSAIIETCNKKLRHKLEDYYKKSTDVIEQRADDISARYVIPKSWVKVQMPRQLSEEQRQKMALRAKANFCGSTQKREGDSNQPESGNLYPEP